MSARRPISFTLPEPSSLSLKQLTTTRIAILVWTTPSIASRIKTADLSQLTYSQSDELRLEIANELVVKVKQFPVPTTLIDDLEDDIYLVGQNLFQFIRKQDTHLREIISKPSSDILPDI